MQLQPESADQQLNNQKSKICEESGFAARLCPSPQARPEKEAYIFCFGGVILCRLFCVIFLAIFLLILRTFQRLLLEGREPPLSLRRENEYLYFGNFFPCTPGPFSCSTGLFVYHSHRAGPVLQEFGLVLRVGVRPLYLCTPTPALGLGVVA